MPNKLLGQIPGETDDNIRFLKTALENLHLYLSNNSGIDTAFSDGIHFDWFLPNLYFNEHAKDFITTLPYLDHNFLNTVHVATNQDSTINEILVQKQRFHQYLNSQGFGYDQQSLQKIIQSPDYLNEYLNVIDHYFGQLGIYQVSGDNVRFIAIGTFDSNTSSKQTYGIRFIKVMQSLQLIIGSFQADQSSLNTSQRELFKKLKDRYRAIYYQTHELNLRYEDRGKDLFDGGENYHEIARGNYKRGIVTFPNQDKNLRNAMTQFYNFRDQIERSFDPAAGVGTRSPEPVVSARRSLHELGVDPNPMTGDPTLHRSDLTSEDDLLVHAVSSDDEDIDDQLDDGSSNFDEQDYEDYEDPSSHFQPLISHKLEDYYLISPDDQLHQIIITKSDGQSEVLSPFLKEDLSYRSKVESDDENNQMMLQSLNSAMTKHRLNHNDVLLAIFLAREFNGLSKLDANDPSVLEYLNKTKNFLSTPDAYLRKLQLFSAEYQKQNLIQEILTGRDNPKDLVGSRLTFIPAEVVKLFNDQNNSRDCSR